MKCFFTATAAADLEGIAEWIAKDSPPRASAFVSEFRLVIDAVADVPRAFPLVPRYEMKGIRRLVHGNYLVFYRIAGERVDILRVVHGARDYEPLLFPKT